MGRILFIAHCLAHWIALWPLQNVHALDIASPNNMIMAGKSVKPCGPGLNHYECQMFLLTNKVRKDHRLRPLTISKNCMDMAEYQSAVMVKASNAGASLQNSVHHDNMSERVKRFQLNKGRVTENVAGGPFKKVEDVFKSWMSSSGHRANILDSQARSMGLSVQHNKKGQPFWAQCFYSR